MYRAALPERRRGVAGLYVSLALTSLLTGVTEPIEFTFLFLAPVLFAVHATLTGLAMVVMSLLGVKLGFGFSAGLLDYLLNYGLATRPLLLLPVGAAYALVYYAAFSWGIRRFDLKTPGREAVAAAEPRPETGDRATAFAEALGGAANLLSVEACTTRLRLMVGSADQLDRPRLTALGARGVLDLGKGAVQVVVGPEADQLAAAIRRVASVSAQHIPRAAAPATGQGDADLAAAIRDANPRGVTACGRRLVLDGLAPDAASRFTALADVRAATWVGGSLHVLLADSAAAYAASGEASNPASSAAASS